MGISGYLKKLREQIGTDLIFLPAVGALILNSDGHILLQRSADDGKWHTIGGAMEPTEQPAEAIIREVKEETNLEVEVEYITEVVTRPPTKYANGDICVYLAIFFKCRVIGGELMIADDESLDLQFFPLEDLPPMDETDVAPLLRLREHHFGITYFRP